MSTPKQTEKAKRAKKTTADAQRTKSGKLPAARIEVFPYRKPHEKVRWGVRAFKGHALTLEWEHRYSTRMNARKAARKAHPNLPILSVGGTLSLRSAR